MTSQAIAYGYEPTGDIFQPVSVSTSGNLKVEPMKVNGDNIAKSNGLQGVLVYGRNESSPNDLTAIDVNNGRLHVNLEEFTSTGPFQNNSRTSAPFVHILGAVDNQNMKTLKCDSSGVLNTTNNITKAGTHLSSGMTANDGYDINIDATGYKSLRIYGSTTGTLTVTANQATNPAFYTHFDTISSGTFSRYYDCVPDNIRVRNTSGGQITLAFQHCLFKC